MDTAADRSPRCATSFVAAELVSAGAPLGVAGARRTRRRLSFASRPLEVLLAPGSLESTIESDSFGGAPLRFHLRSEASVEYVESDLPPTGGRGGTDER